MSDMVQEMVRNDEAGQNLRVGKLFWPPKVLSRLPRKLSETSIEQSMDYKITSEEKLSFDGRNLGNNLESKEKPGNQS